MLWNLDFLIYKCNLYSNGGYGNLRYDKIKHYEILE